MKHLILVRHAKSSWSNSDVSDKQRPLNDRGRDAAQKIGAWLARNNYQPDQVISSSAARCRETWEGLARKLEPVNEISFLDQLYLADAFEMMSALQSAKGDMVLMLGHMPGIGDFSRELRRDPPPLHEMFQKYPTCATTIFELRIEDWAEAQFGTARYVDYVVPRDL